MNRRAAILAVLAMPLGYFKAFAMTTGWLTIDLGQYQGIKVQLNNKTVSITSAEIFAALASVKHGQEGQ
jgi:hypothetical protein